MVLSLQYSGNMVQNKQLIRLQKICISDLEEGQCPFFDGMSLAV